MGDSSKEKIIGFIGLGEMGSGMAANVIKSGYKVVVFDLNKSAAARFEALGARVAVDLSDMAHQCDWIILSLPDTSAVEETLFAGNGLESYLSAGQIVIDCGTTYVLATKKFYERLSKKGIVFIDAPVSGMAKRAAEGTLTIMVGGSYETFKEIEPVLKTMSTTTVYMGEIGAGQLTKTINNISLDISCAALAELLPLAVKMGLDPEKVIEVVGTGTGQTTALNFFGPLILQRDFNQPRFPMSGSYKDITSMIQIMDEHQIPLPVTMAAVSTYQTAIHEGWGNESKASLIKVWEKVLGVTVKKKS